MTLKTIMAFRNSTDYRTSLKRFTICLMFASLSCCLIANNSVNAATYYLDAIAGDNNNPGTTTQPWKTLSKAQSTAIDGDTIKIRNGNYGSFEDSISNRKTWITYQADSGHTPVFSSINIWRYPNKDEAYLRFRGITVNTNYTSPLSNKGIQFSNINHAEVYDLNIIGAGYISYDGSYGIYLRDANYVFIQNCNIYGTGSGFDSNTSTSGMPGALFGKGFDVGILCNESHPSYYVTVSDNKIWSCNVGIELSGSGWIVNNNEIHHVSSDGIEVAAVNTAASGFTAPVVISNNNIHTLAQFGMPLSGHNDCLQFLYQEINHIIVRSNRFHDSDQQGIFCRPGIVVSSTDWLFENNLIYRCNLENLSNYAVRIMSGVGITFRNNTIAGDTHTGGMMLTENESGLAKWTNFSGNIIPAIDLYTDGNNGTVFDYENYNIFNKTWLHMKSHVLGNHTVVLDNFTAYKALFKNYDANDFSISANSLAIGFGNAAYAPISDILGNSRDSSPDAGCYEYVPPDCRPIAVAYSIPFVSDVNFDGNEPVILDGSGSTAPCGSIVDYNWSEYKNGRKVWEINSINPTLDVTLPAGEHSITLKVTDDRNRTATDSIEIIVWGLVRYQKFNEGSGILANDSAGISTAGRLFNGPTWTAQGEIAFDGNDDAVEITTDNLDENSGTIALWAYPEDFSKRRHFLFGETTQHWNNRIQLYCDAMGMLCMGLGNNPDDIQILNLSPNEWYHIALVWDGMSYVVYVDGVQEATGSYSGLNTLQTYADIGNNGNRSSRKEGFDGLIDEVRLYNRPLDANEIMSLALAFLPIDDKTVAEGESLSFAIRTKSGVLTEISDENLPGMPSLVSNVFSWTPDYDDAGTYELTFTSLHLSDSNYEDFETINISVLDTQQFDPVGHWPFDEMSGNFAFDISASGNTGRLLNGLAWESGKINSAIAFSVPNDAVEIRTTGFNPNSGTTAMWVYVDRYTLSSHYLFGYTDTTDTALKNRIQLYLQYGVLCLGLGDSHETAMNIERLQIHQWYHIALTWSWGNYNVYVDGLPAASGSYSGLTGFTANAEIGNNGINRNRAFNGKIDDVYIYNRALTAAEIAQLANN